MTTTKSSYTFPKMYFGQFEIIVGAASAGKEQRRKIIRKLKEVQEQMRDCLEDARADYRRNGPTESDTSAIASRRYLLDIVECFMEEAETRLKNYVES